MTGFNDNEPRPATTCSDCRRIIFRTDGHRCDILRDYERRAATAEAKLQAVREFAFGLGAGTATRRQILDALERDPFVRPEVQR